MSYWKNTTSRSSDRINLLSGGNNSDSFPSSGRKINIDANTFEQQNDLRLQDLSSKLSSLHKITLDIHNDVNDQVNNILDESGNSFTSLGGGLNGTVGKLKHMTSIRHRQHLCYLILFVIGIFFLLYNFWGFWNRENGDEIGMTGDFNDNNARNDV
ncbi:BET1 homolog [Rhizophagus clarus]|uniref:BET1 homolog n=1 Tax=Rhizophagus clarus TaxID=94130 RepID=A0A8H3L249_9GLOM|nr:BET1 homolog [Rhizophagus clarus]